MLQIRTGTRTIHCAMRCEQLPCVFDVVAKARAVATNFLMFCSTSSDGVALVVGPSGVNCVAGVNYVVGRVYNGSG